MRQILVNKQPKLRYLTVLCIFKVHCTCIGILGKIIICLDIGPLCGHRKIQVVNIAKQTNTFNILLCAVEQLLLHLTLTH